MSFNISLVNDPTRKKNGHAGDAPEGTFTADDELGQSCSGAFLDLDLEIDKSGIVESHRPVGGRRLGTLRTGLHRQDSVIELLTDEQEETISKYVCITRFQFFFFVLPMFISLWYSVAVLFPPECRTGMWDKVLWTPGNLIIKDGKVSLCPRASICSEGVFQIILISISRLTAFASYVTMGITFVSKMHSSIHFLASTYLSTFVPFQSMHEVHKHLGFAYCMLAVLHTIGHIIRWSVRKEMGTRSATAVAVSGYFAITIMLIVVGVMSPFAKKYKFMTFERRFKLHWFYNLLIAALCFHTTRCMIISLCFGGLWALDYAYGRFFRTHRLDVVEFTPLKEMAGCQMLWRNPEGFKAKSGEYVKVRLPWMEENGKEWHPFSLYLREATKEGLEEIARETREVKTERKRDSQLTKLKKTGKVFSAPARESVEIDPYTSALLLFGLQNEFISPQGKLHSEVKEVIEKTKMLKKLEALIKSAREEGVQIIHLPIIVREEEGTGNTRGLMTSYIAKSQFINGTEGAKFFSSFEPTAVDLTIDKGSKDDYFDETDLEPFLKRNNLETLIFAGFTLDGVLETTMFKANDLGFRVISLSDGTAGRDLVEHINTCESLFELFGPVLSCSVVQQILDGEAPEYVEARRLSMEHIGKKELVSEKSLKDFIIETLYKPAHDEEEVEESLILKEAREDLSKRYNTSQIFIAPEGDWTNKVNKSVRERSQQQTCWISGPYTSPYRIATRFRHIILSASGIGITPALGVMGQYPGNTKTKVLVWMTRSKVMLKFFAPLLKDCHLAVVFYTGKDKLTTLEINNIYHQGNRNIFIQQKRPKSLEQVLETIVVQFENSFEHALDNEDREDYTFKSNRTIEQIVKRHREDWCLLYCGGSVTVERILQNFAQKHDFGWNSEFFNW